MHDKGSNARPNSHYISVLIIALLTVIFHWPEVMTRTLANLYQPACSPCCSRPSVKHREQGAWHYRTQLLSRRTLVALARTASAGSPQDGKHAKPKTPIQQQILNGILSVSNVPYRYAFFNVPARNSADSAERVHGSTRNIPANPTDVRRLTYPRSTSLPLAAPSCPPL